MREACRSYWQISKHGIKRWEGGRNSKDDAYPSRFTVSCCLRSESTTVEQQRRGSHLDHPNFHITPNSRNPKPGCVNRTLLLCGPSPIIPVLSSSRKHKQTQINVTTYSVGRWLKDIVTTLAGFNLFIRDMRSFVTLHVWTCFMKPFLLLMELIEERWRLQKVICRSNANAIVVFKF